MRQPLGMSNMPLGRLKKDAQDNNDYNTEGSEKNQDGSLCNYAFTTLANINNLKSVGTLTRQS